VCFIDTKVFWIWPVPHLFMLLLCYYFLNILLVYEILVFLVSMRKTMLHISIVAHFSILLFLLLSLQFHNPIYLLFSPYRFGHDWKNIFNSFTFEGRNPVSLVKMYSYFLFSAYAFNVNQNLLIRLIWKTNGETCSGVDKHKNETFALASIFCWLEVSVY
jgi:hypothetical protein